VLPEVTGLGAQCFGHEDAGIKLATVARDILGTSGRAMLEALVQGTRDPAVLAELARGRMRAKLPALRQALVGHFRPHHAFLTTQILAHLDHLEMAVATLSARIEAVLAPFADAVHSVCLDRRRSQPPRHRLSRARPPFDVQRTGS